MCALVNNISIELYIIVINGETIVIMNYLTIRFNVLNQFIGQFFTELAKLRRIGIKLCMIVCIVVAGQNENKKF